VSGELSLTGTEFSQVVVTILAATVTIPVLQSAGLPPR
jgi:hypothetical protein